MTRTPRLLIISIATLAIGIVLVAIACCGYSYVWECVLIRRLKSGDDLLSREAAEALSEMGSEAAVEPLLNALQPLTTVRYGGLFDYRFLALVKIGKPAVRGFLELLESGSEHSRVHAVVALGRIGPAAYSAVPALVERLASDVDSVRAHIPYALIAIAPDAHLVAQAFASVVSRSRDPVRADVIVAIREAEIRTQPIVEGLLLLIDDPEQSLALSSATALAWIAPEYAAGSDLLRATVQDGSAEFELREDAAVALVNIYGSTATDALPILQRSLESESVITLWEILPAFEKMGNLASSSGGRLEKLCCHQDAQVRTLARAALSAIRK